MNMSQHIVKSFDQDLDHLNAQIATMGQLVVTQIEKSIEAVINRDEELASKVILGDQQIDQLEHEIDDFAVRTIALRQPVAGDLRTVIAALKVATHLERTADYANNIAKRAISLVDMSKIPSIQTVPQMTKFAQTMIEDVLQAYIKRDDSQALAVWKRDIDLDEMYMGFLRELLTYMMEDPRNISPCTQLLFVAKNIERIGDQATNIAEMVHYQVFGKPFEEPRPKGKS